jgi:hypothetical protein
VPNREPIVGIPGFEAFEITGTKQVVTTTCKLHDKPTCPGCKSAGRHRRKDLVKRRIRHTSIGMRAHWLVVHVPKWSCRCGRYFRQRVPGVLPYVSDRITDPCARRFSIAHELGHFVLKRPPAPRAQLLEAGRFRERPSLVPEEGFVIDFVGSEKADWSSRQEESEVEFMRALQQS